MPEQHPNVALLQRFDPRNIATAKGVFSEDVVWHFFNPKLPDIQGDFVGLAGLQSFFQKIGEVTEGTIRVNPVSTTTVGDELVVTHSKNSMTIAGETIETDVVVVWRVVNGRVAEVWDIPSVHAAAKHMTPRV